MLCGIFENILMFAISAKNSDIRLYYEYWIYRTYLTYDYWTYSYNAWYLHRIMIADRVMSIGHFGHIRHMRIMISDCVMNNRHIVHIGYMWHIGHGS